MSRGIKNNLSLIISLCFVIVIMSSVLWLGVNEITKNNKMLDEIVKANTTRLNLAHNLNNLALQSRILLRDILISQNDNLPESSSDNSIESFYTYKRKYHETFSQLKNFFHVEDTTEMNFLNRISEAESKALNEQIILIQESKAGLSLGEINLYDSTSYNSVENWIMHTDSLINYVKSNNNLIYSQTQTKVDHSKIFILILCSISIILSLLIFVFIYLSRLKIQKDTKEILKLKRAINNSSEVFFMTDKEGVFTFINQAFTNIYGYTHEEVVGKETPRILNSGLVPEEVFDKLWKTLFSKQSHHQQSEFINKKKNGELIDIECTADVILDEKGNITGFLGIQRDISKRKLADKNLKSALEKATESDRLKSVFLATMSHELRTPLNAIIGFSTFLDKNCTTNEAVNFGKIINSSGNHLLSIVDELFDITLIESDVVSIKKQEIQLHSFLNDIYQIIKVEQNNTNKEKLTISLVSPPESDKIYLSTDQTKLKQILLNLLKNALKFTPEGFINFGYRFEDPNKTSITFFVEDSGIGIPKDKQEIVFDIFRQADDSHTRLYGGIGIGLSIAKRLSALLGGDIWFESEEGNGSTFYFTIPFESQNILENKTKPKAQALDKKTFKNKTILVVEDVESNFEFLKHVLDQSGIKTIWAKNGREAIQYCYEEPDIALVLMDLRMPVLNGYEATREIKKFNPELPIIAQTAFALHGDKEKALEAGCDGYITKPIKKKELIDIIKSHLL